MWENSLVVFHSDNGGEIMAKGEPGKRVEKGFSAKPVLLDTEMS